ncbi:hypothetical protein HPB48_004324 [Haemaphysalis longicornis]|uniref:Uncharacterized protein n=1 Tax=Haemaphysalis longicornis TaxID=44386 RepID=A0A9J6G207_HAELO|nr:hypothetical protein HPB48_004324 [Haemaphysalis longicornis]
MGLAVATATSSLLERRLQSGAELANLLQRLLRDAALLRKRSPESGDVQVIHFFRSSAGTCSMLRPLHVTSQNTSPYSFVFLRQKRKRKSPAECWEMAGKGLRRPDAVPPGFVGARGRRQEVILEQPPGFVGARGKRPSAQLPLFFQGLPEPSSAVDAGRTQMDRSLSSQ